MRAHRWFRAVVSGACAIAWSCSTVAAAYADDIITGGKCTIWAAHTQTDLKKRSPQDHVSFIMTFRVDADSVKDIIAKCQDTFQFIVVGLPTVLPSYYDLILDGIYSVKSCPTAATLETAFTDTRTSDPALIATAPIAGCMEQFEPVGTSLTVESSTTDPGTTAPLFTAPVR